MLAKLIKEIFHDSETPFDNAKALGLIDRVLRIATGPDDIVLDSFAGSGTTAHAVLALNKEDGGSRKFILVECEDYADTITAERVRRVINGVPTAKDTALKEGLGGSFTYMTLGDPLDIDALLTGESLPSFETLAQWLLHTATGRAATGQLTAQNYDGLFYSDEDRDYYLLYRPDLDWLSGNEAMLTPERAERIAPHDTGRQAVVYAANQFMGQRALKDMRIIFCQLPYEIHRRPQ